MGFLVDFATPCISLPFRTICSSSPGASTFPPCHPALFPWGLIGALRQSTEYESQTACKSCPAELLIG